MSTNDLKTQREVAIHLLRSGIAVQKVAKELKRSVSWVYKSQKRYKEEGWTGLEGHSQAPKKHGRKLKEEIVQAIIQARSELEAKASRKTGLKYIGPASVLASLQAKKVSPLPSIASISRVLKDKGMSKGRVRKKEEKIKYPHLKPKCPHQLVQVDIVPHFLKGGEAVACFNAIDVVSHYPTGYASSRWRSQDAARFLLKVWQEIGIPKYTQVDNEGCFSGGTTHKAVLGKVVRLALFVGTELVFSPVYHPQSNHTVERFHQDYDFHVWQETDLKNRDDVLALGSEFFQEYRHSSHIKTLKGQTPHQVHYQQTPILLPSSSKMPDTKLPLVSGRIHFLRRVYPNGLVSVLNLPWAVPHPNPLQGVWVTIEFTSQGATLFIYDAPPDVLNRKLLVSYPFPLKELIISTSDTSYLSLSKNFTLKKHLSYSNQDVKTSDHHLPNYVSSNSYFIPKIVPTFIQNGLKSIFRTVSTIY